MKKNAHLFEDKPRWNGAPLVCLAANRMAFDNRAELAAFREANAPRLGLVKVWRCKICGALHYIPKSPDPAGESSGTGRSSK
jgi:hypothetical protein